MEKLNGTQLNEIAFNLINLAYPGTSYADKDYVDGVANALENIQTNADKSIQNLGECNIWFDDLFDVLKKISVMNKELEKTNKPEAFYTGGGIWLAAVWCEDNLIC